MRKSVLILALLLVLSNVTFAEQVSVKKAVFLSLLIPGTGEIYAKSYNRGAIFLGTELLTYFSYFQLKKELDWAVDDYKNFAGQYAGIEAQNYPDEFYQKIQDWDSSERYNDVVFRDARNFYLIYSNDREAYDEYLRNNLYTGDNVWEWNSTGNWRKYRGLRQHKQDIEIYTKFVVGAALITRLISVIDAAGAARRYNRNQKDLGHIRVIPEIAKKGLMVQYEYKF